MSTLKEVSRGSYTGEKTTENIQTGCLQRIADATELMSKNWLKMESDLEYLRRRNKSLTEELERVKASKNTLKGVVTKLKKKIQATQENIPA